MRLSTACSRSERVERSKPRVRTNLGQRSTTSQKHTYHEGGVPPTLLATADEAIE
jgi:hypothetical protein